MSVLLINSMANRIPLADGSVHLIATSPPYYGLRDYGLPPTEWPEVEFVPMAGLPAVTVPAWTGCLGLEPDPLMFVAHIVHIMREARRVLRDDGTAWVNFGDSYASNPSWGRGGGSTLDGRKQGNEGGYSQDRSRMGLKAKDLMGIPWRVAFALQADGWWLRSDVIWSKDNPMPESVNGWRWERHRVKTEKSERARNTFQDGAYKQHKQGAGVVSRAQREAYFADNEGAPKYTDCPGCAKCDPNGGYILRRGGWRPTSSHEYIFMLAKSENYYSDREAVVEEAAGTGGGPFSNKYADAQPDHGGVSQYRRSRRDSFRRDGSKREQAIPGQSMGTHRPDREESDFDVNKRNKRSVWNVNTKSYAGAHFATWPPDLVEPMIKSSTSERGVCPACGAPWVRVIHKNAPQMRPDNPNAVRPYDAASGYTNGTGATTLHMTRVTDTVDWRPSCACPEHDPVPAVVLDIFSGSGTTLQVARQLGRHGIGLDLSFTYLQNEARTRLSLDAIDALENGGGIVASKNPKGRKPADGQIALPLFGDTP